MRRWLAIAVLAGAAGCLPTQIFNCTVTCRDGSSHVVGSGTTCDSAVQNLCDADGGTCDFGLQATTCQ